MRVVDYSQDASVDGMWHAAFVRSPVAHGRVRSLEELQRGLSRFMMLLLRQQRSEIK